ncbi:MAG: iron-sulfur cluster assembly scaffold protein [Proteobacteria bacterium]|jgi:nitrogen fixation protein NifU and related proteins|nr:iron-sulfur cluster assembly scaffold protein [Pseudomonadota bacterium]
MAYTAKVVERFNASANLSNKDVGSLDKNDINVGTGIVGAPSCGDVMKFQIKVGKNGVIEEAKFKTFGCGSAIASSALAVEWVKGKTLDQARTIKNVDIVEHLSLPPVKIHCSVLAEGAIKAAIADYKAKQNGGSSELHVDTHATHAYKANKIADGEKENEAE